MRNYSREEIFDGAELRVFESARRAVRAVPDTGFEDLRCHELVRAVVALLCPAYPVVGMRVVDGVYGTADHSWIGLVHNGHECILDVYAVGSLPQVRLVDLNPVLPYRAAYRSGPPRTDIRGDIVEALLHRMVEACPEETLSCEDC